MKEIWCADCETEKFLHGRIPRPFIWGAYNGCEYHQFNSTKDFLHFIVQRDCYVYAHNGGKFDWHFITNAIPEFTPIMLIAGRLSKFKIGNAEFRDSFNILPFKLAEYKKDDFDYDLNEAVVRDIPRNRRRIENYLRSDCVNLFEIVSRFIDEYGLNLTLASAAMKMWRKISGTTSTSSTQSFYGKIAPYYYGGRVECNQIGIVREPFKLIDLNSAYPDAMTHLHPFGTKIDISRSLPKTDAFIARSFITLEADSTGAFPWREAVGKKLTFPNDGVKREFKITGHEFLAAIETNTLRNCKIKKVLQFADSISFVDYVEYFSALKIEAKLRGDTATYLFAKLFLNSLYGKYGSNPAKYNEYMLIGPEYIQAAHESDDYGFVSMVYPWALCSRPLPPEKHNYFNVAVAASITGLVRSTMWRSINIVSGYMYGDTDSLFCTDTGNLELHPTKLGAWDIEAECDYGGFAGKKTYAVRKVGYFKPADRWKTACKGAKLSPFQILRVANGEILEYKPDAPTFSIKSGIKFTNRKISATI